MAQAKKGTGKGFTPIYGIPWKTFENFIDVRLQPLVEKDEVPPRIDRGFLKNLGGNAQTYLMSALRAFGLTDEENNVLPALVELAREPKGRPAKIADLWRSHYAKALDLGESKSTHGQLEETWRQEYGQGGDTMRKAITFFMHGAQYAGLTLSPHWSTTKAPTTRTSRAPRRRRTADAGSRGAEDTQAAPRSGGDTYTVELKSGGSVSVTVSVPFWDLNDEDQDFALALKRLIKGYKGKPLNQRAPKKKAQTPEPSTPESDQTAQPAKGVDDEEA